MACTVQTVWLAILFAGEPGICRARGKEDCRRIGRRWSYRETQAAEKRRASRTKTSGSPENGYDIRKEDYQNMEEYAERCKESIWDAIRKEDEYESNHKNTKCG